MTISGIFPKARMRRLRGSETMRRLVEETSLRAGNLIYPLFVAHGKNLKREIDTMPGQFHFSVDRLVEEAAAVKDLGIPAILLFGLPESKDAKASGAWAEDGIVQRAARAVKDQVKGLLVITDVCLCGYTDHGHCGVIRDRDVDNDATLDLLARTALSQVRAGADMVAPSDMMDGRIGAIRTALDEEGFIQTPILSYAAKYASSFYGPFREAADSAPRFGDRRSYQMDPPNVLEAIREVELDIGEGADIVMVKPAMPYLDVIRRIRERFSVPVAAYQVSGEYSMIVAAAERGWIDRPRAIMESLLAIRRAGAGIILTYFAKEAAGLMAR
ncbi:MAG: porphobilinogen synthase [Acidobacteria bacterium]|nr:porphobilinogen synthase [Acidobacteriota bacterium]